MVEELILIDSSLFRLLIILSRTRRKESSMTRYWGRMQRQLGLIIGRKSSKSSNFIEDSRRSREDRGLIFTGILDPEMTSKATIRSKERNVRRLERGMRERRMSTARGMISTARERRMRRNSRTHFMGSIRRR